MNFQIHEDIDHVEALHRDIQVKKQIFGDNYFQKNKEKTNLNKNDKLVNQILRKKSFLDNYRENVSQKCPESFDTISSGKKEESINGLRIIEEPFLQVEKENVEVHVEPDGFPSSLLHNFEYRKEIWGYLRDLESRLPPPHPIYMSKQKDINWESRSILVDWLASVGDEYKFSNETFHLGVIYLDRFLSQLCVTRNKLQLVGAAAMMLASKMEEYYPLGASEWSYLTGDTFTPKQVLKMEKIILKVLKFRMQIPTVNGFIQHLATEQKMDEKTVHLAMYIGELVLLEGDDYLEILPSKVAAACIALARYTLWKRTVWPKKLKAVSGYSLKELSPVVQKQNQTLGSSPMKKQQAIQSKYKSEKLSKVALTRPRKILLYEFDRE
ncbi:cyclin-A2-like [Diorhabda sublineata]|uniref:cyclin-A2-like n=1 Tax=Diorhabda sublineata TaxID=1163346 RepID=UPI0024E19782|nr:cyclin-A2-like [Diorhabda sublineata]